MARIVSFEREVDDAYIAMPPVDINTNFAMTMKVKTLDKDGLVFYTTDDTQVCFIICLSVSVKMYICS